MKLFLFVGHKWSDWTPMDFESEFTSSRFPGDTNCGAVSSTGKWLGMNCNEKKNLYICKIKKRHEWLKHAYKSRRYSIKIYML